MDSKVDKVKNKVKGAFKSKDLEREREGRKPPENMATSITRGFENVAREQAEAQRNKSTSSGGSGSVPGSDSTWQTRWHGDSQGLLGKKGDKSAQQAANSGTK